VHELKYQKLSPLPALKFRYRSGSFIYTQSETWLYILLIALHYNNFISADQSFKVEICTRS